jgi:thiamine-phosphate pyrophosphorylase
MPAEGAIVRLDPRALRLYVITPSVGAPRRTHEEIVASAVSGGAGAVQLRAPELDDDHLRQLAVPLASMCADAGVLFVVNDRVDVAVRSRAAGAHVGQDGDPRAARDRLGTERILGVSVGTDGEARAAEAADADYLGVTVWSTSTKPEAVPVGLDGLRDIVAATALPVVGIGGIDARNAREVLAAGASGIAVIGAVASADDPLRAVRELRVAVDGFYDEER